MPALYLGIGAYKRLAAGAPEIKLVNRFVEASPGNAAEHVMLMSRSGTSALTSGTGTFRGSYSTEGLFNSDAFYVAGSNFYRYSNAGVQTHITGTIFGSGHPNVSYAKGLGYEHLFISDGLRLNVYTGGSAATATLTKTGAITTAVIQIGSTYYGWNATVDFNTPDGTASHPYLANPGSDPIQAMVNLLNYVGTPGTDFSTNLPGANTLVYAAYTDSTHMLITSFSTGSDANSIATTKTGSNVAWGGSTMTGANVHALQFVPMPGGVAPKAVSNLASYVFVSVGNTQEFFWITPGAVTVDPLNFASKDSGPDNVVDMLRVGDQLLITGAGTTEAWYATGDATAPFLPVSGRVFQRGTVEGTSVVVKDEVIMVGNDGIVYTLGRGGAVRISDHGIEERIIRQLRREAGL